VSPEPGQHCTDGIAIADDNSINPSHLTRFRGNIEPARSTNKR
jgi:hypothetical protein